MRSRCASITRFAELPDANYKPRVDDPRAGFGGAAVRRLRGADRRRRSSSASSAAIAWRRSTRRRASARRRSRSSTTSIAARPSRSARALLEGARWWNQAFEAAGYRNAFRVELLPEGADPMDIRYNMINWVHRSTRGWSTGATITDPRTGEIIKATVTLGSLRDRQDYLIFEGLLAPYKTGTETPDDPRADGARAHPPALGARSRPHARPRPPVLQQHEGAHLGDGLSAPAREAQRRRHHRPVRRIRGRHRRVGQGRDRLRLPGFPARHRRSGRAPEDPGRRVEGRT